jgi:hypothetical protein
MNLAMRRFVDSAHTYRDVLALQRGDRGWESALPEPVAPSSGAARLFGYQPTDYSPPLPVPHSQPSRRTLAFAPFPAVQIAGWEYDPVPDSVETQIGVG